jgi:succinate dehydrogenase hydrophobic anchor subunit
VDHGRVRNQLLTAVILVLLVLAVLGLVLSSLGAH